jgi:hypothetical protein
MLLIFAFVIAACEGNQSINKTYSAPPLPTLAVGDKQVTVVRGSSCWNSNGSGQCIDMVSPNELLKNVTATVAASGSKVKTDFDYTPKELTVNLWTVKGVKPVKLEPENAFVLPSEKGTYIYNVSAHWKEGTSDFVFTLEVK